MTKWLILKEAAEYLRCNEDVLQNLVDTQAVPHSTFAGQPLFLPERLDEYLLSREVLAAESPKKMKTSKPTALDDRTILHNLDRMKISAILDEFEHYNNGNELFVNSLGRKLRQALTDSDYKTLSGHLVERLSRWCHAKKRGPRNEWTQERARKLSMILFGEILKRNS